MGLPHQFYSSIEDISRCLSTVTQTALDQTLEGLGPFQQPLSQALQVLCLYLRALHQKRVYYCICPGSQPPWANP